MQAGTVSRLRFCGRSWGLKIYFGWNIVRFLEVTAFVPISWMCKKQTSVSHSSTESEIISLDAGLRLDGIPALVLWDLIVAVLGNTNQNRKETGRLVNQQTWNLFSTSHDFTNARNLREWPMIWIMLILFPQTSNLLIWKLCCMCLKTTKQWSRWSLREEGRQWDMFSRTHRVALDCFFFYRINFDSKIQIKYIWHRKPTRRHTDQGKLDTWWMESSSVFF